MKIEKFQESENSLNAIAQQLLDTKNDEIDDLLNKIKYLQEENEKYVELAHTVESVKQEKEIFIDEHKKTIEQLESELKKLKQEKNVFVSLPFEVSMIFEFELQFFFVLFERNSNTKTWKKSSTSRNAKSKGRRTDSMTTRRT